MNLFTKNNLEDFLDQMGSMDIPECTEHRYELRRKLLNSKYFDEHRNEMRRRAYFFVPVVASGFAAVFLLVAIQGAPSVGSSAPEERTEIAGAIDPDFLTDGLVATFVDDRPIVPVTFTPNTVSYASAHSLLNIQ